VKLRNLLIVNGNLEKLSFFLPDDEIVCLGSEPIKSTSPVKLSCRAASKAAEQRQVFLESEESEGPTCNQDKTDDDDDDDEFKVEGKFYQLF
jgi:hypothetical protein